jgi:hypothetical protein
MLDRVCRTTIRRQYGAGNLIQVSVAPHQRARKLAVRARLRTCGVPGRSLYSLTGGMETDVY